MHHQALACVVWCLVCSFVTLSSSASLLATTQINENDDRELPPVAHIRIQDLDSPLGIDVAAPTISWHLDNSMNCSITMSSSFCSSENYNVTQTAFRILVQSKSMGSSFSSSSASSWCDQPDMWDTGKLYGSQMRMLYGGKPLSSLQYFAVCVQWWQDESSSPLAQTSFSTAIMNPSEWQAMWIGDPSGTYNALSGSFSLNEPPEQVAASFLLVSGLGWSETFLNGQRLHDSVLDPGWTYYPVRCLYSTLALTSSSFVQGLNTLTVLLGGGHYSSFWLGGAGFPQNTKLLLELHLFFVNGSSQTVISDSSWKMTVGPISEASIYGGEHYNASNELGLLFNSMNNNMPDLFLEVQADWMPVTVFGSALGSAGAPQILGSQLMPPIRRLMELSPVQTLVNSRDRMIVDFGQNFAGWVRINVSLSSNDSNGGGGGGGAVTGDMIQLRHAEIYNWTTEELNTFNLGFAAATDRYILSVNSDRAGPTKTSPGHVVYEPRFTYHGFRYCEVTIVRQPGSNSTLSTADISLLGVVIGSDLPQTGGLGFSDSTLTQLQHNLVWSQRSQLMSVPTDCPQRDERLGWMADAHVSATECLLNFDSVPFYRSFMQNMQDNQDGHGAVADFIPPCDEEMPQPWTVCNRDWARPGDPAWSSAFVIIAWQLYRATGDRDFLRSVYPALKAYLNDQQSHVNASTGLLTGGDFGDWYAVFRCDTQLVSGVFQISNVHTLYLAALVLDEQQDAADFELLEAKLKEAYHFQYFNSSMGSYNTSTGTQSANALPLYANIPSNPDRARVADALIAAVLNGQAMPDGSSQYPLHLTTGVPGTVALFPALQASGRIDLALQILQQTTFPGYGFMTANNGTTLWERWSDTLAYSDSTSRNHIMWGSVGAWLYSAFVGIGNGAADNETAAGYEVIRFQPDIALLGDLLYAGGQMMSVRGLIVLQWSKTASGDGVEMQVRIPPNAQGLVYVPLLNTSGTCNDTRVRSPSLPPFVTFSVASSSSPTSRISSGSTTPACLYTMGSGQYTFRRGRNVTTVCGTSSLGSSANVTVSCPDNLMKISAVLFASYGTPEGSCGLYSAHRCHAPLTSAVVATICIGQTACSLPGGNLDGFYGIDPVCDGSIPKQLVVQLQCWGSD